MAFQPEVYNWTNGGAGLLLAILGAVVAWAPPRRVSNVSVGAFLMLFGTSYVATHLGASMTDWPADASMALPGPLWAAAAVCLVPVMSMFPVPMDRRHLLVGAAAAVAAALSTAFVSAQFLQAASADGSPAGFWGYATLGGNIAFFLLLFSLHAAALFTAVRFRDVEDGFQRRRLGVLGLAFALYLGAVDGSGGWTFGASPFDASPEIRAWTALNFVWRVAIVAAWLRATGGPNGARQARNVAFSYMIMALVGLLVARNGDEFFGVRGVFHGVARLLAFTVLGYAVLTGRFLGIDRPARLAVKSSALGGVFLGTALVIGQVVENLAQDYAGAQNMGVLAGGGVAGLLLVGIHPLERFAKRMSDRAVPHHDKATRQEAIYREQSSIAWRDGVITRKEHELLLHLRERLGLTPEAAARIDAEIVGGSVRRRPRA